MGNLTGVGFLHKLTPEGNSKVIHSKVKSFFGVGMCVMLYIIKCHRYLPCDRSIKVSDHKVNGKS